MTQIMDCLLQCLVRILRGHGIWHAASRAESAISMVRQSTTSHRCLSAVSRRRATDALADGLQLTNSRYCVGSQYKLVNGIIRSRVRSTAWMQCSSRVRRPSRICITDPIGEFQGASVYARTIGDKQQEFTPPIILWPSGAARAVWSDTEKNHRSVILARQQSVVACSRHDKWAGGQESKHA